MMKNTLTSIPELYANWMNLGWSMLAGMLPGTQAKELPPKPAQVAAEQEWEDEGGSVKQPKKPQAQPAPKRPL
jgi:hypothetical protein